MIRPDRIDSSAQAPAQDEKCGPVCRCCAALAAARAQALFDPHPHWRSPLTPGMQAVNLSHSEDGQDVWASLGRDWPRMFSQLSSVGSAQVLTFNAGAILSRRLDRVRFDPTSDGAKCVGCRGTLRLDFRHLGSARAVHWRRANGHSFGVEFTDQRGEIVHALMLTHASDFDAFFAWVRLHQACAVSPRSSPGRRDASFLCQKSAYLWEAFGQEEGTALLTASIRQAVALQVTVFSMAASQTLDLQIGTLITQVFLGSRGATPKCIFYQTLSFEGDTPFQNWRDCRHCGQNLRNQCPGL